MQIQETNTGHGQCAVRMEAYLLPHVLQPQRELGVYDPSSGMSPRVSRETEGCDSEQDRVGASHWQISLFLGPLFDRRGSVN